MKTSDFDYALPTELIAQKPVEPRDSSRLLVVSRSDGKVAHHTFRDVVTLLQPGDVLVLNDSRVVPARLRGKRVGSGGAVEALLLRREGPGVWEALVRPANRLRAGARVLFSDSRTGEEVEAEVEAILAEGTRLLRFPPDVAPEHMGEVPLPPYIHERLTDPERYQTVYAQEEGSAAAPTAGLHFSPELLQTLAAKGVELAQVTLHVGLDTFRPVRHEDPQEHGIHKEFYRLSEAVAGQLTRAVREGRRIVCVGTTAVRSVEDAVRRSGWSRERARREQPPVLPYEGLTGLYILPGHHFLAVDALITNFHLPRTTLLMLVCAFAGKEHVLAAYSEAVRLRYRFYSFGDALLFQ